MRFGIVINMDYGHHPQELLTELFHVIRSEMEDNGFRLDGRVFSASLAADTAGPLARGILENINRDFAIGDGDGIYRYIKEFYGFDIGTVQNLLLPEDEAVTVEEYDPALIIEEIHLA